MINCDGPGHVCSGKRPWRGGWWRRPELKNMLNLASQEFFERRDDRPRS